MSLDSRMWENRSTRPTLSRPYLLRSICKHVSRSGSGSLSSALLTSPSFCSWSAFSLTNNAETASWDVIRLNPSFVRVMLKNGILGEAFNEALVFMLPVGVGVVI